LYFPFFYPIFCISDRLLERFSLRLNRQRSRFSLILRMILSEQSATPAFAGASFFGIMR